MTDASAKPIPPALQRRPPSPSVLETSAQVLAVLLASLFFTTFVVEPNRIPSESMVPTLEIGDFVLVEKIPTGGWPLLPRRPLRRGDLVVFKFPPDPTRDLVKRVVGLPGDRIRLQNGLLYRNGERITEPFATHHAGSFNPFRDDFPNQTEADPDIDPAWWIALRRLSATGEITVPPGNFFVLGDNRDQSEDSRYWGFVAANEVVGRPLLVYFSSPPAGTIPMEGSPLHRMGQLLGYVRSRIGLVR